MPNPESYDDLDLVSLSVIEHARQRPSLYLGGLQDLSVSANCMAREAFCIPIDSILRGQCSWLRLSITEAEFQLSSDAVPPSATPSKKHAGKSEFESMLTERFICQERAATEYVSENVCRISLQSVVLLARDFCMDGFDSHHHWSMAFHLGESEHGLQRLEPSERQGVDISFAPDQQILGTTRFDVDALREWFDTLPLDNDSVDVSWR